MGLKKKGQMFLVASFLLCALLFGAVISRNSVFVVAPYSFTDDLFSNMASESKNVVNIMVQENETSAHIESRLIEYVSYINMHALERNIDLNGYLIVALPYADNNLNVTIISFENYMLDFVSISIDGTTKLANNLDYKVTQTLTFQNVPDLINFTYIVSGYNGTGIEVQTDTINITRRLFSASKLQFLSGDNIRQSLFFY